MKIDTTINLGEALGIAALLIGLVRAHQQNQKIINRIETKVDLMFSWWQSFILEERKSHEKR